ncbi:hypothetical protein C9994_12845 [Marivirga lumbricoides]|uniref:RHS repeat-associated core domain-containing protein n=1 Tax=Marivirga lumbricoides TaxID=1046115 RepID=A0A2T4DII3_9BACT|nr:hypothetical protein C9994_12845 [Marivirga lumbricoides]
MLPGGVISGEGPLVSNNLTSGYTSAAIADNSNEQSPRAYLNYIMLDKDFNYLNSGFDRLSTSAEDPGDGSGTHQKLSFEEILIDQDGYLIVFLSNESQQTVEVFWDDFRVDHHHNAVLQADDYYPFGLTFNSYQRSYSKANNYKYNGFEEQVEWGVYDYQARYYDPALGRFLSVDPLADLMRRHSPYNYAYDNPIRFTDPDGMMPDCPTGNCGDAVSEVYNEIQSTVGAVADAITGAIDRAAGKLDNLLNSISGVSINTSLPSDDSITGNEVMKTGNPDEVRENGVVLTSEDDNGVEEQSRAKNTEVFNADNLDPEKNISKFLNVSKNSESNYHYVSEETIIGEVWEFNQNVPGSYIITKDTLVSPKNQDGGFGPARTANVNERRAIKNGKIELNETKIKVKKN